MTDGMKWYKFDPAKGSRQKRPPIYRQVLVKTQLPETVHDVGLGDVGLRATFPVGVAVGYRKNAAGDKQSPFFVVPGIGGSVSEWCDCLPEEVAGRLQR